MTIIERTINDIKVLDLDGNLSLESNAQFRKQVNATIDAGARKLIINFARVPYMDSNGLGEIISCYRTLQEVSGHLKLLNLSNRLLHLLVITNLINLFETFDSEPAAISSFNS